MLKLWKNEIFQEDSKSLSKFIKSRRTDSTQSTNYHLATAEMVVDNPQVFSAKCLETCEEDLE